jgi:hypothetical protein
MVGTVEFEPATSCSGCLKSRYRSFTNQAVLELGQCTKNVKHEPATGAGCVDSFCQGFETDLAIIEILDDLNQVLEGSS